MSASPELETFRSHAEEFFAETVTAAPIATEQQTPWITCSLNLVVAETLGRT